MQASCATMRGARIAYLKRQQRLDDATRSSAARSRARHRSGARYSMFEFPNWAAKFFADALMMDLRRYIAVPPGAGLGDARSGRIGGACLGLSVMILCGRSPRHLYVANRLCEARAPLRSSRKRAASGAAGSS